MFLDSIYNYIYIRYIRYMIIFGKHYDDVVKVYSKHLEIYFMYKIIVYTNFWKSKRLSPFLSLATIFFNGSIYNCQKFTSIPATLMRLSLI